MCFGDSLIVLIEVFIHHVDRKPSERYLFLAADFGKRPVFERSHGQDRCGVSVHCIVLRDQISEDSRATQMKGRSIGNDGHRKTLLSKKVFPSHEIIVHKVVRLNEFSEVFSIPVALSSHLSGSHALTDTLYRLLA